MSQAISQHAGVIHTPLPGARLAGSAAASSTTDGGRLPTFVAGPENELLAAVMNRLVTQLGQQPPSEPGADVPSAIASPLVLVGPNGSGKTHLARGIVELWKARRGEESAEYFTATDFGHALAGAIHAQVHQAAGDESDEDQPVRSFRRSLHRKQLLVIDDVHRLGESPARHAELRHLHDAIAARGGLLILTSTAALAEATSFDRALLSRLAGGLTLEIARPGQAARQALLEQAAEALDCRFNADALQALVEGLPPEPPRVLRAAVELRRRGGTCIDVQTVERLLEEDKPQNSPPITNILRVVARYHKVPLKLLTSASRRQSVVSARAVAIYLARELTPLSYAQIGQTLGGRDHTTIMHNYRRIAKALPKDRALRSAVDELKRLLGAGPSP